MSRNRHAFAPLAILAVLAAGSPLALPASEEPKAESGVVNFKSRTGLELVQDPQGRLVVRELQEQSEASRGGVKNGDILVMVNDLPVNGAPMLERYLMSKHASDR